MESIGLLAKADNFLGQRFAAFAALGPNLAERHVNAEFIAALFYESKLDRRVCREGIDGYHAGQAENVLDVVHMLKQVGQPLFQRFEIFVVEIGLGNTAMVLERTDRCNDHDRGRLESGHAALDVQELLCAEIGGKARLCDGIITELERHARGRDTVAPMRNVRKRTAMDKGRRAFERLHKVGLERVLQQGRHSALGLQIVCSDRLSVKGVGNDHPAKAGFQISNVGGKAQHCHNLTCYSNIESILAGDALRLAAETVYNVAELAVVHIDGTLPSDLLCIDAKGIALLDVIVEHCREQVVRSTDRVKVAGKVKVDVLHGDDLSVATTGCAALDAEHRAERRLAQRDNRLFTDFAQTIRETDRSGGLSLTGRCRSNGGNENQLAVRLVSHVAQQLIVNLGLVVAVLFQVFLTNADIFRNFGDFLFFARLSDFNIRFDCHIFSLPVFILVSCFA